MRYVTPIYFQRVTPGEYNAETGNYGDDIITEERRFASVMDSGTETLRLVYGTIKQGSKTILIQLPYTKPFDYIRIGEKRYSVDFARRQKAFVASEVQ